MSEGERIERLTELARRVWPDTRVIAWPEHVYVEDETPVQRISVFGHPHALDALEAALLVLSGETPLVAAGQGAMSRVLSGPEALRLRIGYERTRARAEDAETKLAAVHEVIGIWERDPADAARVRCAAALREMLSE